MEEDANPVERILSRIHAGISFSEKWKTLRKQPYHVLPRYMEIANHLAQLSGKPLISCTNDDETIDVFDVFDGIVRQFSCEDGIHEMAILITEQGEGHIGVVVKFKHGFTMTTDIIWNFVNCVVGKDIVFVTGCDIASGSSLEVLTGDMRYMFSIDVTLGEMTCTHEEFRAEAPMICFICSSSFLDRFQDFAMKVFVSMCFRRRMTFTCGLGQECLLINIPFGADCISAVSRIMFSDGITHRVEHMCSCDGIDGTGECHVLCNVSTQKQGKFSLFLYVNGQPVSDPKVGHNILSAIKWSDFRISILPCLTESSQTWPFSVTFRTLGSNGFSYAVFANSSLQESIALSVKAIEGAFTKLLKKIPVIKARTVSVPRLDGVWRNIDHIVESISSMVDDVDTKNMWANTARMITEYQTQRQKGRSSQATNTSSQFVDNRSVMFDI